MTLVVSVLTAASICCVLTIGCSNSQPAGVPKSAQYVGNELDGVWIDCDDGTRSIACSIFTQNGSPYLSGDFSIENEINPCNSLFLAAIFPYRDAFLVPSDVDASSGRYSIVALNSITEASIAAALEISLGTEPSLVEISQPDACGSGTYQAEIGDSTYAARYWEGRFLEILHSHRALSDQFVPAD